MRETLRVTSCIEALEDRTLLAAIAWTGAAGDGLWHTPGNWSALQVPAAADDVTIDVPSSPTISFTSASGERTVASLVSRELLTISGGQLSIGGAATLSSTTTLSGGTLALSGQANVTGTFRWLAGTLAGGGSLEIAPGATLATQDLAPRTLSTTVLVRGVFNYAGNLSITLDDGTLTIAAGASMNWSGVGNLNGGPGGPSSSVNNYGSITKSGIAAGSIQVPFANYGTFTVRNAALLLFSPSTLGGNFIIESTGAISLGASVMYVQGVNFVGAGQLGFSGGQHLLPQGALSITGEYIFGAANVTISDTLRPTAPVVIPTVASVTFNAPQSLAVVSNGGNISGTGDIEITQSFTWTQGTISGSGVLSITSTAVLNSSGNGRFLARNLDNRGTATFQSPGTLFYSGAVFTNYGVLNIGASQSNGPGFNRLINYGVINKTSASNLTITQPFLNLGTFNSLAGGLTFTNLLNYTAATNTLADGAWNLSNGATLSVNGGFITTIAAGTSVSLSGAGSSINQLGSLSNNRGTFTLSNGRAFTLTPAGNVFNNYGTFVKGGTGTVSIASPIILNNPGVVRVEGGQLDLASALNGGEAIVLPGAVLRLLTSGTLARSTNQGTLDIGTTRLTVTEAFAQTATGRLAAAINEGGIPGLLRVTGVATLAGELSVIALGGFDASEGYADLRALIVQAPTRTGGFTSASFPAARFGSYSLVEQPLGVYMAFNYADANSDGGVDGADVEYFFLLWASGNSLTDVNADGGIDGGDIEAFFNQWSAGGPS